MNSFSGMRNWGPPEGREPAGDARPPKAAAAAWKRPEPPAPKADDYPLAFWGLVAFSCILFVAPQNNFEFLKAIYPAKASAILALLVYVFQRFSRGQSVLPSGTEYRLLTALVALACISIPISLWPGGSMEVLTDLFLKSVLIGILVAQILTSVQRFTQMLWFMLLFCFIAAMVAIQNFQLGMRVEGYRMMGGWAGISANPNDFALTINLILPFSVALFSLTRNPVKKFMAGAFMVVGVGVILATYSRTGFLTLAIVLLLALVKHVGQGQGLKYVLPVAIALFAVVSLVPADYESRLQSIVETSKDKVGSRDARLAGIHAAIAVTAENPLFGVGLGVNNLALNAKGLYWAHVHNVYLQFASEIGVPGLIVFVILLVKLLQGLRAIQSRLKNDPAQHEIVVLAGACEISLLAFCIAAFFHPVAYHFYFFYIAGFALALKGIVARLPEPAKAVTAPKAWWPPQIQPTGIAAGA